MFRIKLSNSNENPIFIQVEPWANLYQLNKGDEIEIIADSKGNEQLFTLDEHGDERFLTLLFSDEYFVMREGKRVHWRDFPTNIEQ